MTASPEPLPSPKFKVPPLMLLPPVARERIVPDATVSVAAAVLIVMVWPVIGVMLPAPPNWIALMVRALVAVIAAVGAMLPLLMSVDEYSLVVSWRTPNWS